MIFYDVKTRQKIETEIIGKKGYQSNGQIRYAVKAKTADGRSLTRFVSKKEYDSIQL